MKVESKPTLLILAAGRGRRYGGLKQLEPVGPGGMTIMDYSGYDALRAGFGRIVFVIQPEMEAEFRSSVGARCERHAPVAYVHQRLDVLPSGHVVPPGRTKPWGTGQAVLAAEEAVGEPFAVVNADDFFGAQPFAAVGQFLRENRSGGVPTHALVGYALRDTLTDTGPVSRAVCSCTREGWLKSIREVPGIERCGRDGRYTDAQGVCRVIRGDVLVSMNMWGLTPAIFGELRRGFQEFLESHGGSHTAEFYLPGAIDLALRAGRARVRVLPSQSLWTGMTHPQDKACVAAAMGRLIDQGEYPRELWGAH